MCERSQEKATSRKLPAWQRHSPLLGDRQVQISGHRGKLIGEQPAQGTKEDKNRRLPFIKLLCSISLSMLQLTRRLQPAVDTPLRVANWERVARYSSTRTGKQHDALRILFCGADEFSIYSLRAVRELQERRPEKIAAIDVVCRPDKRVGRGLRKIQEGHNHKP